MEVEHRPRFTRRPEDCMGEIRETIQLENERDRALFEADYLAEDEIRTVEIEAIADTGARALSLPEDLIERLGVKEQREVKVSYADDRREMRAIVGPINVTVAGRTTVVDAVSLPAGSEALIGQIVMERLDLVADCVKERLVPSPDSPHYPELSLR